MDAVGRLGSSMRLMHTVQHSPKTASGRRHQRRSSCFTSHTRFLPRTTRPDLRQYAWMHSDAVTGRVDYGEAVQRPLHPTLLMREAEKKWVLPSPRWL